MGNSFTWLGGSLSSASSWSQPDPMNPVEPGGGDSVTIVGTGTVAGSVAPNGATVSGTFTLDGSILSGAGTSMGAGKLTLANGSHFGGAGMALNGGTIIQNTGAAVTAGGTALHLAFDIIGGGTYDLKGGTIDCTSAELLGDPVHSTSGTVTQSDGTNTTTGMQIFSGLYTLTNGTLNVGTALEYVGDHIGSTGTFAQTGGTHTINGSLQVGYGGANGVLATGEYDLSGGTLAATGEYIGQNAHGTVTQKGGTTTLSDRVVLGINLNGSDAPAGTGTYTLGGKGSLTAGVIFVGSDPKCHGTFNFDTAAKDAAKLTIKGETGLPGLIVGGQGIGTFNQGRGDISTTLAVGYHLGSTGDYNLKNGTLSSTSEVVGGSGIGTFTQTDGKNVLTGSAALQLGTVANSTGNYILQDGSISGGGEVIGLAATGTFTQRGGLNNISDTKTLDLGVDNLASGTYKLVAGDLHAGMEIVGNRGGGTFNQTGGTNTISSELIIGSQAGGVGEYTLSGGSFKSDKGAKIVLGEDLGATGKLTVSKAEVSISTLQIGKEGDGVLTVNAGGRIAADKSITIAENSTLDVKDGFVVIGGGDAHKGTVSVGRDGELTGNGTIKADLLDVDGAKIVAMGGTLKIEGSVDGTGDLKIGSKATLDLIGPDTNDVRFSSSSATLELNKPVSDLRAQFLDMAIGNKIVLDGMKATEAVVDNDRLKITLSNDSTMTFGVTGNFNGAKFSISHHGADSTLTLVSTKSHEQKPGAEKNDAAHSNADHFVFGTVHTPVAPNLAALDFAHAGAHTLSHGDIAHAFLAIDGHGHAGAYMGDGFLFHLHHLGQAGAFGHLDFV